MHSLGRRALALAVVCSLSSVAGISAPKPLGMVIKAESATLSRAVVQAGTNVYAGDRAVTNLDGQLQLQLGSVQVFLGSSSEAMLQENDSRVLVYLTRGTAGFASSGEEAALLHVGGAWVRPQSTGLTQASIKMVSEREFLVSAKGGALEVVLENESLVVPQNQTARVSVAPEDKDQDKEVEGVGKREERRRRMMAWFIGPAAAAAIVIPIVLSNTHPNRVNPPVSPSVP